MAINRLWQMGLVADKVRIDAKQQRSFYIKKATNAAKMPDSATAENIKNGLTRLFPINAFDTSFGAFGTPSQRPVKNTK